MNAPSIARRRLVDAEPAQQERASSFLTRGAAASSVHTLDTTRQVSESARKEWLSGHEETAGEAPRVPCPPAGPPRPPRPPHAWTRRQVVLLPLEGPARAV